LAAPNADGSLSSTPSAATDPHLFVSNLDGGNLRRVLDKNKATRLTVPGYAGVFGCGSCSGCEAPNVGTFSCSASGFGSVFQLLALFAFAQLIRIGVFLARPGRR
jgi:hypothetical protein